MASGGKEHEAATTSKPSRSNIRQLLSRSAASTGNVGGGALQPTHLRGGPAPLPFAASWASLDPENPAAALRLFTRLSRGSGGGGSPADSARLSESGRGAGVGGAEAAESDAASSSASPSSFR